MLDKYLEFEDCNLVFIGDFNPAIFQPYWFAHKGLIREDEAEGAKVHVVHKDLVQFSLDWMNVEINKSRAVFATNKKPYFDVLRDLVLGTFRILNETPIKQLGINFGFVLSLKDPDSYYLIGDKLCPMKSWTNYEEPRLLEIELNSLKDPKELGSYRVKITPQSSQTNKYGVRVNYNDHFDNIQIGDINQTDLASVLEKNMQTTYESSCESVNDLLTEIFKDV